MMCSYVIRVMSTCHHVGGILNVKKMRKSENSHAKVIRRQTGV